MKMTSLVTGGAGFIGSYVAKSLLDQGHRVVVLDDLSGGTLANVPKAATLHQGSITDTLLVQKLFEKYTFTYVFHLAAYAAEGLSHFIRKFNYQNNLLGSVNLINAAVNHRVKCFVFASSIAVYGTNTLPLLETHIPKPQDPYGIAKYAVELDLENARQMFGLDYIIFRPHNVYGPHQNIGDKYRNVVGIFMNQILQGKPLSIFGDGSQTRAFSYIDDVAPYMAISVTKPHTYNQIFNIGSDHQCSVIQLAQAVSDAMQTPLEYTALTAREEVVHAYADHTKFETAFAPQKQTSLQEGLDKMAHWVRQQGARSSMTFETLEIKKNLPPAWHS